MELNLSQKYLPQLYKEDYTGLQQGRKRIEEIQYTEADDLRYEETKDRTTIKFLDFKRSFSEYAFNNPTQFDWWFLLTFPLSIENIEERLQSEMDARKSRKSRKKNFNEQVLTYLKQTIETAPPNIIDSIRKLINLGIYNNKTNTDLFGKKALFLNFMRDSRNEYAAKLQILLEKGIIEMEETEEDFELPPQEEEPPMPQLESVEEEEVVETQPVQPIPQPIPQYDREQLRQDLLTAIPTRESLTDFMLQNREELIRMSRLPQEEIRQIGGIGEQVEPVEQVEDFELRNPTTVILGRATGGGELEEEEIPWYINKAATEEEELELYGYRETDDPLNEKHWVKVDIGTKYLYFIRKRVLRSILDVKMRLKKNPTEIIKEPFYFRFIEAVYITNLEKFNRKTLFDDDEDVIKVADMGQNSVKYYYQGKLRVKGHKKLRVGFIEVGKYIPLIGWDGVSWDIKGAYIRFRGNWWDFKKDYGPYSLIDKNLYAIGLNDDYQLEAGRWPDMMGEEKKKRVITFHKEIREHRDPELAPYTIFDRVDTYTIYPFDYLNNLDKESPIMEYSRNGRRENLRIGNPGSKIKVKILNEKVWDGGYMVKEFDVFSKKVAKRLGYEKELVGRYTNLNADYDKTGLIPLVSHKLLKTESGGTQTHTLYGHARVAGDYTSDPSVYIYSADLKTLLAEWTFPSFPSYMRY